MHTKIKNWQARSIYNLVKIYLRRRHHHLQHKRMRVMDNHRHPTLGILEWVLGMRKKSVNDVNCYVRKSEKRRKNINGKRRNVNEERNTMIVVVANTSHPIVIDDIMLKVNSSKSSINFIK